MSEQVKSEMTEAVSLQVGDVVKGKVVKVERNQALVDVGYKSDAILPISEISALHVEQVSDELKVDDEFEVKVIRLEEEGDKVIVSKRAVVAEKAWKELQEKLETGETITATVADVVKGGLVVNVGVRGFIPASHVERHFVEDFSDYKGRELTLKVVELDPEKNKLILSRKLVLEEEEKKKKAERLNQLEPGQIVEGTVQRLTDFGAFVDLGGIDGLVHVSELAWNRVEHPSDVLAEGQTIQVKILKVDRDNERISLSLKETRKGPWEQVADHIKVGDVVTGTVKRLASFGAFVEVYPGVEGLVHISQISRRHIGTPQEVLEEGQEVQVKVLDMQLDQKRISLSMKELEEEPKKEKVEEEKNVATNNSGLNVTLGDMYPELRNLK
ncbi:30S ribosomal protein S1 [Thermoflavimicrobium dichotomicum]|uniref:Small subunit ribosomal protein S1 n=1 Tax=Thermoflavimicrobium dichotomicum TaxID=46223 RepID=A0A1I3SHJ5_9BACL|nr:30S ribosomal protein S1 [Thermoflavimicrobium dichotomicum]SFJ57562.1 small subunit ribosomal protein S1 [Thermoflavimicrobium dichotomicum]